MELEDIKTSDIESDEADIFERQRNFEVILKRMEEHNSQNPDMKGRDLRYNIYLRKLKKLTRKDLGLDVLGFKDYISNLRQFSHLNKDFELFINETINLGGDYDLNLHRRGLALFGQP